MSKPQPIRVPIDAEMIAEVDELAVRLKTTREQIIEAAIHDLVDRQDPRPMHARLGFASEAELEAFLKPALEALDAGRVHEQAEVDALFDDMISRQRARAR